MTADIPSCFERYQWPCAQVDQEIWRTSFASKRVEDFDLYVARGNQWIHFAVSPFTPLPSEECKAQLYDALLQLNQQTRLARFAVDKDGDVNLLADLPAVNFDYSGFATVIDTLVYYTQHLAHEVARTATEPGYHSSLI